MSRGGYMGKCVANVDGLFTCIFLFLLAVPVLLLGQATEPPNTGGFPSTPQPSNSVWQVNMAAQEPAYNPPAPTYTVTAPNTWATPTWYQQPNSYSRPTP